MIGTHGAVWLFFVNTGVLGSVSAASEPYCWPFFEDCWRFRLPSPAHAILLTQCYLFIVLIAGAALFHGRPRIFWWTLLSANIALFGIVSLDYRLRANEFYMLFWINGVFLALPYTRWAVPVTIASFYFWAGTLKLNEEWLSGSVLYRDLWLIPKWLVPAACAYVVLLEMVMIWGLLAAQTWILVAVLVQLALFHIQSLSQIHWIYPLLMATMLSWFVIERRLGDVEGRASLRALLLGRAPRSTYTIVIVFAGMQMVPILYRGNSTLTGQGRLFALHMFEARQQCEVFATPSSGIGAGQPINLKVPSLSPRMVCDPIVYLNRAQNMCRNEGARDRRFDLHLFMRAKRATDTEFETIVDQPDFCTGRHQYRLFRSNQWVR